MRGNNATTPMIPYIIAVLTLMVWTTAGWEYRIREGGARGLLNIRPNATSPWGTVCATDFPPTSTAVVACVALGFATAGPPFRVNAAQETGPVYMDNVACSGDETGFDECRHSDDIPTRCEDHLADLGVECLSHRWEYRLFPEAGGNGDSGRFEARPNVTAPWGTLCGVSSSTATAVLCRSVGLERAGFIFRATGGMGPVYLKGAHCFGNEATIDECATDPALPTPCETHENDIGVNCQTTTWEYRIENGGRVGKLQIRPNVFAPWGSICGERERPFREKALQLACAAMGYDAVSSFIVRTRNGTNPVYKSNVACYGAEVEFEECSYNVPSQACLDQVSDVGVECAERTTTTEPSPSPPKLEPPPSTTISPLLMWRMVSVGMIIQGPDNLLSTLTHVSDRLGGMLTSDLEAHIGSPTRVTVDSQTLLSDRIVVALSFWVPINDSTEEVQHAIVVGITTMTMQLFLNTAIFVSYELRLPWGLASLRLREPNIEALPNDIAVPERRRGLNGAAIAAIVISIVIAGVTIIVLVVALIMRKRSHRDEFFEMPDESDVSPATDYNNPSPGIIATAAHRNPERYEVDREMDVKKSVPE